MLSKRERHSAVQCWPGVARLSWHTTCDMTGAWALMSKVPLSVGTIPQVPSVQQNAQESPQATHQETQTYNLPVISKMPKKAHKPYSKIPLHTNSELSTLELNGDTSLTQGGLSCGSGHTPVASRSVRRCTVKKKEQKSNARLAARAHIVVPRL